MTTHVKFTDDLSHSLVADARELFNAEVPLDDLEQYCWGQSTLDNPGSANNAFYDRVTETWFDILGTGTSSISASGVVLDGPAYCDLGDIDLSAPFTVGVGVTCTRSTPSGSSTLRMFGTSKASTGSGAGWYQAMWGNANSPGAAVPARVYPVVTLNGTAQSITTYPELFTPNWSAYCAVFTTHLGGGNYLDEVHRLGQIYTRYRQYNLTDLTTPGGAVQKLRLGGSLSNQMQGTITYDFVAHWSRAISDAERRATARRWAATAINVRGRNP